MPGHGCLQIKRAACSLTSIIEHQVKSISPSIGEQYIGPVAIDDFGEGAKDAIDKPRQLCIAQLTEPTNVAEQHRAGAAVRSPLGTDRRSAQRRALAATYNRLWVAGMTPIDHINGSADGAVRRVAIPDSNLLRLCAEVSSAQDCQSHRELAAITKERVVTQIAVLRGVAYCAAFLGRSKAFLKTLYPTVPCGTDRDVNKFRPIERQHDMKACAMPQ